jgi:hypothetical protein
MKERIFPSDANGRERFGPEIADFENEGNLAGESDPPPGEADQELWRRRDDHTGARKSQATQGGGEAKRRVVAHAFVRLAVGQGPEPSAEEVHATDSFLIREAAETGAPFRRNDADG